MSNTSWAILIFLVMAVILGPVAAVAWLVIVALAAALAYLVLS